MDQAPNEPASARRPDSDKPFVGSAPKWVEGYCTVGKHSGWVRQRADGHVVCRDHG